MFKNKASIEQWLKEMEISNYVINDDLTVDVHGSVYLEYKFIPQLPVQFNIVTGNFSIIGNEKLTSLKGCPIEVHGDFDCYNNNLQNLRHLPKIIGRQFDYFSNPELDVPIGLTSDEVHAYYLHKDLNEQLEVQKNTNKQQLFKI